MPPDPTLIGSVQAVSGATVTVELVTETATGLSFVDGEGYRIGQVGSFVRIPLGYVDLYGVVSQVGASPTSPTGGEARPYGRRSLTVQLVGEGRRGGKFSRGVSQHPTIDDRVHIVTEADLRAIYGPGELIDYVKVGHLASAETIPALVDIAKLVTRHSAVVGTTGSGKSNVVATILHSLADKIRYPSARIVLLDIHGEYGHALKSKATLFKVDADPSKSEVPLFIPYWALRSDELWSFVIDGLQDRQTSVVADSILAMKREAAQELMPKDFDARTVTIDSPLPFSIHKLWLDLYTKEHGTTIPNPGAGADDVRLAYVLDKKGEPIQLGDAMDLTPPEFRTVKTTGPADERVQWGKDPLGIRSQLASLYSKLRDPRFNFMYRPGDWTPAPNGKVAKDLDALLESWIGGHQPIAILDLSGIPPAVLANLIGALLRMLYDAIFWSRNRSEGGKERPLLLVLEEAHAYLGVKKEGVASTSASEAVKRIAKEGRKYGVGLMLVSQRPSEIDPTILSQCGTMFAMRLANDTDRGNVTGAAADNLKGLFEMLPVLRTGEAVIVGEAVSLPMRTYIARLPEGLRPDSDDPRVVDREGTGGWNREREPSDYAGLVEQMRRQEQHYRHRAKGAKSAKRKIRDRRRPMNWIDTPESSNIARIGYDGKTLILYVEFTKGGVYRYFDVPEAVFHDLRNAGSKGQFFARNIKGAFRYARE